MESWNRGLPSPLSVLLRLFNFTFSLPLALHGEVADPEAPVT